MFDHKENLRRLKLFKELEPDFKIDKVFYLMESIEYDFKYLDIGSYIVSKPFVSSHTGDTIVTLVDLERKMQGHKMDISTRTKFFEDFNEKSLSSFLYWGESYE